MKAVVVGIFYPNRDGSSRSAYVRRHCKVGAAVQLIPEPDNPHDGDAVAVFLVTRGIFGQKRRQIGYIKATTAMLKGEKLAHAKASVFSFSVPKGDNTPRVTIEVE